jgi:hypothetical protein
MQTDSRTEMLSACPRDDPNDLKRTSVWVARLEMPLVRHHLNPDHPVRKEADVASKCYVSPSAALANVPCQTKAPPRMVIIIVYTESTNKTHVYLYLALVPRDTKCSMHVAFKSRTT